MRICFGSTMSSGRRCSHICRLTSNALIATTNQQAPDHHDDRRILSGIMPVQMVGCRWKDCPREYGPHKTIYNRFARRSGRLHVAVSTSAYETLAYETPRRPGGERRGLFS